MGKPLAVLGVAVLVLAACGSSHQTGPSAPPPVSPPAAASPKSVILENFGGANVGDAKRALEELGLKHDAQSDDGRPVLDPYNWTVADQDPSAGTEVETGSTVKLTVVKQKPAG
jgi:hypothetical protein